VKVEFFAFERGQFTRMTPIGLLTRFHSRKVFEGAKAVGRRDAAVIAESDRFENGANVLSHCPFEHAVARSRQPVRLGRGLRPRWRVTAALRQTASATSPVGR
jgi:hypothetical protein